jgi:hypothetical protein
VLYPSALAQCQRCCSQAFKPVQKEALLKAVKEQAEVVYEAWQTAAYRSTQRMAAQQDGSIKDFARHTIKAAHFFELMQRWCALGNLLQMIDV